MKIELNENRNSLRKILQNRPIKRNRKTIKGTIKSSIAIFLFLVNKYNSICHYH